MSMDPRATWTLEMLERGGYEAPSGAWVDLREAAARCVERTVTVTPEQLAANLRTRHAGEPAEIEVVDDTTQRAAARLAAEGEVVLLNFASARNPGGGFLRGAKAQEEDLCRCSALYPALAEQTRYYEANRAHRSTLYTDHAIYSPSVPFFRLEGSGELLERPFIASVITAPAPNAGALRQAGALDEEVLAETFLRRWAIVLEIARAHGHRVLLLGAWGCGAFGNDPEVAAATAREALGGFGGCFDRVVFAIPGKGRQSLHNLEVFRRTLS